VHFILGKPWNDKEMDEETHAWWWEIDEERQTKETEAGLSEPEWK